MVTCETIKFYNQVTGNSLLFHADKGNIPYLHEVLARPNNGLSPEQKTRISEILNPIPRDAILPSGQRTGLKRGIAALLESDADIRLVQGRSFFQRLPLEVLGQSLSYLDRRDITALSLLCNAFQAQHQHAIYLQFAEKKHFTYQELEDFRLSLHLQKITDLFAINPILSKTRAVSLTFQDIPIRDKKCIALIARCPRLSGIKFIKCPHITDESILKLAKKCPKLSSIWIENCQRLRDASLYFSHFPHLVKIGFKGNSSFNPASYVNIPRACPHLRVLELVGTRFIPNPTIDALFALCSSLEEFHADCYPMTPELLKKLAPNLKKTTFADTNIEIFQKVIELFPDIAIHNETVLVSRQTKQAALIGIIKHCPKLKSVSSADDSRIFTRVIMKLAKYTLCRLPVVIQSRTELQQKPTSKLARRYQNLLNSIADSDGPNDKMVKDYLSCKAILQCKFRELPEYYRRKILYQIAAQQGKGYVSHIPMRNKNSKIDNYVLLCNFLEPMLSNKEKADILDRDFVETVNKQNLSVVDTYEKFMALTEYSSATLTVLDFSKFTLVLDSGLINVSTRHKSLISINLSECAGLTDASIIKLAKANPNLTEFNASGVVKLTSNAIKMLAASCPKLKVVKLLGCDNLEADSVNALISNCKNLSHLETSIWKKCGPDTALALAKSQCKELGTFVKHPEIITAVERYRKEYGTRPQTKLGRFYHSLLDQGDLMPIQKLVEYFLSLPPLSLNLQALFSSNLVAFCDAIAPMIESGTFPPLPKEVY